MLDVLERRRMENKFDPGHLGKGVAGQIILSRTKPAGDHHQRGALGGHAKSGDIVIELVGHGRVPTDNDADFRQPLA